MGKIKNLIAGFTGAIAINLLQKAISKQSDDRPYIQLLGEDALNTDSAATGQSKANPNEPDHVALGTDVVSHALYYSLIGTGKSKYVWPRALGLGLSAGIGAIRLPQNLTLNEGPATRNTQVQALTVGYYVFGALMTALTLKMLK